MADSNMADSNKDKEPCLMDEIDLDAEQSDEKPAEDSHAVRRQKNHAAIAAYLKSFSASLEQDSPAVLKKLQTLDPTVVQDRTCQKKAHELENAIREFFHEINKECSGLARLAQDDKLSDKTVADIFEAIHTALEELMGTRAVGKPHDYYFSPAHLIQASSQKTESEEPAKVVVTQQRIITHVENRIKRLKKDCHALLDKDYAKHGRYAPHLAKVGRVAGIVVATLLAAVAGAAIMFVLGNYSNVVFAANVAKTISSQLGLFVAPGLSAGVGGFVGSYYVFFKTGARAKTNRLADSISHLMKARLQYMVAVPADRVNSVGHQSDEESDTEVDQGSLDEPEGGCCSFLLQWAGFKSDPEGEKKIASIL